MIQIQNQHEYIFTHILMSQQPLIELKALKDGDPSIPFQRQKSTDSKPTRKSHLSVVGLQTGFEYIRDTWKSGMAQAILNMPFHLTIGSSSGCNANVGVTTAFIAAFVNGFFSGSNHSIYMPSWVVIGLNYQLVKSYGVEVMPWVTVIVGVLIYITSLFKWHRLSDFIPVYVIEGFLLGIASLFFLAYSDYMFGLTDNHANRGVQLYSSYYEMYESYITRGDLRYALAAWFIFACLQCGRLYMRPFPWVLCSTLFGIAMGILYPTERCLRSAYGDVGISFHFIEFGGPKFEPTYNTISDVFFSSIPITLFILVQNQFCARAGQSMTGVKCDYDQEIQCVSCANIISGIFGGLPCCASSRMYILDMKLRDTNKWASLLNAASILLFYGYFSKLFMNIPLYVISGQLLYMILNIPPYPYFINLYKTGRKLILFYILSIAWICVNFGAIQSTLIGSMHSLILFAKSMSKPAAEIITTSQEANYLHLRNSILQERTEEMEDCPNVQGTFTLYRFNGALNYINIKGHIDQIKQLGKTDNVILSFRYVSLFDFQAVDSLAVIVENLKKNGTEVLITGLHQGMEEELCHNQVFKKHFEGNKD